MRKRISIILVTMMLVSAIFVFAGCSNEKVDQSKALVEEYFEHYDDYDADDIIDLMHDDLIDIYDSKDDLEIVLLSRIAIYGDIDEYKLVGTSYYKNNGEITVSLDYEVTYERTGETLIEVFEFLNDGEDMLISNIINENDKPYDEVPDSFFEAYEDGEISDKLDLFSDSIFNYIDEETLVTSINTLEEKLGNFSGYEKAEEWYYFVEDEEDDVTIIYEGIYDVTYQNGVVKLTLQLCMDDDEIKIYDILWDEE